MHRHLTLDTLPTAQRGASVAMGNFDGVHKGHQSVIDLARRDGAPLGVITFEPHPRELFAPDGPPFRLMHAETRANRLEKLGVDVLCQLPFDKALAGLSAEDFAQNILVDALGISHVVVGEDFCFGKARQGNATMLKELGAKLGFDVTIASMVATKGTEISSTAIRSALAAGRPDEAAAMLGHWHRIEGEVVHGDKRGRDLGFPTANMPVAGLHLPRLGVYAALVDVLDGPHARSYKAAVSLGVRPTFGENLPNLESYLLDFDGDLYGARLSVALVEFQRPELKFDDLDALIKQMHDDVTRTRQILNP